MIACKVDEQGTIAYLIHNVKCKCEAKKKCLHFEKTDQS